MQTAKTGWHRTTVATGQGLVAVLLWAGLAALTVLAGPVPPFQLAAMTFAVGTVVGLGYAAAVGEPLRHLASVVPWQAWAFGVYGLLTFHVCYFHAVQNAPPVDASLIIYTWPLLIVLFSGLLPAAGFGADAGVSPDRLRWHHVAGGLLGFAGTALILLQADGAESMRDAQGGSGWGYVSAMAAALIWSSYSVGSRLFSHIPSTAVIGACAFTAVGAFGLHLAVETTVWPQTWVNWLAVLGLGLGPVGLAFYVWDHGMKHGDIRFLGVGAYATPLLSTVILAAFGLGAMSAALWLSACLITGGALVAALDKIVRISR